MKSGAKYSKYSDNVCVWVWCVCVCGRECVGGSVWCGCGVCGRVVWVIHVHNQLNLILRVTMLP